MSLAQEVIPQRIRIARQFKGLSQAEIAQRLGVSQAAIARFENGTLAPSEEVVGKFTIITGLKRQFFLVQPKVTVTSDEIDLFRKKNRSTIATAVLADQVRSTAHIVADILSFAESLGFSPPNKIPVLATCEPSKAALLVRRQSGLQSHEPVRNLKFFIENLGGVTALLPTDLWDRTFDDSLEGYCARLSSDRSLICVAPERTYFRDRLTTAHELGHMVLGHHELPTLGQMKSIESDAFDFATELLCPKCVIRERFSPVNPLPSLQDIKREYRISMQAIFYHGKRHGLIPAHLHKKLSGILFGTYGSEEPDDHKAPSPEKPQIVRSYLQYKLGDSWLEECSNRTGIPHSLIARVLGVSLAFDHSVSLSFQV